MLLFKIFLYINMSPNEEIEDTKEKAFNSIRDLMLNAGIPRNKIDAMFAKFDRPVTTLAKDKLQIDDIESCDYSDLVNEFADIINDNNKLITADDYNNIYVTIDNTELVLDSYRMIHDKQYNRIRELSNTRKNENRDLNENLQMIILSRKCLMSVQCSKQAASRKGAAISNVYKELGNYFQKMPKLAT